MIDSIQNALKELYISLGGDASAIRDENDVNDLIRTIAGLKLGEEIQSGGGLPEVTADDNGDVLTVVEGEWGKAAPSGGTLIVHIGKTGILDKTWQEISDAVEAGNIAMVYDDSDIDCSIEYLGGLFSDDGNYGAAFVDFGSGSVNVKLFVADSADGYPVFTEN